MVRAIEHNFTIQYREWEIAVFKAATHFRVVRFHGKGVYDRREFNSFDEALADAKTGDRPMVYAVTGLGRHVLLCPQDWDRYEALKQEREAYQALLAAQPKSEEE